MAGVDDDPYVVNYLAAFGTVGSELVAEAVARPADGSLDDASVLAYAAAAVEYFAFVV
jgi:hypothetical protein